jgi:hypothetical protein
MLVAQMDTVEDAYGYDGLPVRGDPGEPLAKTHGENVPMNGMETGKIGMEEIPGTPPASTEINYKNGL